MNDTEEMIARYVDRMERLLSDIADLQADMRELASEIKDTGLKPELVKQVAKLRLADKAKKKAAEIAELQLYGRAAGVQLELDGMPPVERAEPAEKPKRGRGRTSEALRRAMKNFVNVVAKNPGDSVSLTGPDGVGFSIRNDGGRKIVEPVGGPAHDAETGEVVEDAERGDRASAAASEDPDRTPPRTQSSGVTMVELAAALGAAAGVEGTLKAIRESREPMPPAFPGSTLGDPGPIPESFRRV